MTLNDVSTRLESISTEICIVVIAVVSAWTLALDSKDVLLAAVSGLVGYLSGKKGV